MKLLVTGALRMSNSNQDCICRMGHSIDYVQNECTDLNLTDIVLSEYDGVICNSLFQYTPIHSFPSLKYIQLTSAGTDRVDMDYIKNHGIKLNNARGVYSIPMAEFAVSSVLYFYKSLDFFRDNQRNCCWRKHRGLLEIFGKTVCILGCGDVGTECAKRFQALGCNVVGLNRTLHENDCFDEIYPLEDLCRVVANSDIVIVTLALTDETRGIFGDDAFSYMKNGAVLVNISRGPIINNVSMIEHLSSNRIYAALDVFDEEPLSKDSPLWYMDNVLITPHNSFVSEGNQERLWNVIRDNLENYV